VKVTGWGRFPRIDTEIVTMRSPEEGRAIVLDRPSLITRGNGRAYGDAALNARCTLSTLRSNRILALDTVAGLITCEAGLLLSDLLEVIVPRGFFPPVTPGTRFVTIGGMVACDVHGKNHHTAGSFSRHVESLMLLTADGALRRCSRSENAILFDATCGGMGLTGTIVEVTFRLLPIQTARIRQETRKCADLDETIAACENSGGWTYSVAWIDCLARGDRLGRGVMMRGEHARPGECSDDALAVPRHRMRRVPVDLPHWSLNRFSVSAFNALYYGRAKSGLDFPDYETFFYPLDAVLGWNRIYGAAGLVQYQCVLPYRASRDGIRSILERVAAAGRASFLAVLKLFGPGESGYLSFPMEGFTLTLDFPADTAVFSLMLQLDAIVADHGGRLYLAKDARGSAEMMRRGYPRLGDFMAVRDAIDPNRKMASLQSARLGL
jgi:FAD/FMN-containing dehydrogenase